MIVLASLLAFAVCSFGVATHAETEIGKPNESLSITISAQAANRWKQGAYDVWLLRGNCRLQQGAYVAACDEAVLWVDRSENPNEPSKIIAYFEGNVDLRDGRARLTDGDWFGRFFTNREIQVYAGQTSGKPDVLPPIFQRAMEKRQPTGGDQLVRSEVQQAQFARPIPIAEPSPANAPQHASIGDFASSSQPQTEGRRIRIFSRSDVPYQLKWEPQGPDSNVWIGTIDQGVNMVIDGMSQWGTIDISADRIVVWTTGSEQPSLTGGAFENSKAPMEIYMEGNIVFRQGDRVIYAERMYYDVTNQKGTVINAEMLTPVPGLKGYLRLRADIMRQTDKDHFYAQNAFVTSSRMGEPSYKLQSGDIAFSDIHIPTIDPRTGRQAVDETGKPISERDQLAEASSNFVYLGPVPVFYWPYMSTNLKEPTYYIRRARVKYDKTYGLQFLTDWNGFQLLGLKNPPKDVDFDVSLDYLGKRGFGHGGTLTYTRDNLLGFMGVEDGRSAGLLDYWGIADHGTDNLGVGRNDLVPEKDYRYRLFWQHRTQLPYDVQLSAELGWISDRNFLESYYKREWDEMKDEATGIELKHTRENRSLSLSLDARLNDFFTQTEQLPRVDHFWIGQEIGEAFTWYEHSNAGYMRFQKANAPTNPADQPFQYLPWEKNSVAGERAATRQEIDWPFQLGAVKVVPYALGEFAHWGEDIDGQQLNRLYWQAGLRANLPVWSVDPTAQSELFNVNGIAHKVNFVAEFLHAESNKDLEDLPLYDPLDDDSIEAFRRRFIVNTYGGSIPKKFDERWYAVRSGLGSWVTSPSTEVVDDLTMFRLAAEQRWQTKRGGPNTMKIVDWISFDAGMNFYPKPNEDDYGKVPGLIDYDAKWHVGDRLTLVSDGLFDVFDDGQKTVSVGGFLTRPPRGSLYLGFRFLDGPIEGRVVSLSYSYLMSPKWSMTFGASYDCGKNGNIGQYFSITRIGESFLVNAGFNVDPSRNDVGINISIEPRFVSKNRLANQGGVYIPPSGVSGLE